MSKKKLFGIDKLNIKRSEIPAVTHVDYSARIQTVHKETNPRYYDLITEFKKNTNCPVLVNTSFNVRGEPIVTTPEDAFRCFMGTELDNLAIGNCYLIKSEQEKSLKDEGSSLNFNKCVDNKKIEDFVLNDRIEGTKNFEINATPTIIINNKKFEKSLNYKNLKKSLEKLI